MINLLHNSLTTPSHDGGGRVQLDRQLHARDPGEQETKFSDSHEGGKSSDSQVVGKTKSGKSHGWVNSTVPDEIAELCKVLASIPGLFCTNDPKFSHTHMWNQFAGRLGAGLKMACDQHFVTTTCGNRLQDLYVVENVHNTRDLKIKLHDYTISVRQQGAEFVLTEGFSLLQDSDLWYEAAR